MTLVVHWFLNIDNIPDIKILHSPSVSALISLAWALQCSVFSYTEMDRSLNKLNWLLYMQFCLSFIEIELRLTEKMMFCISVLRLNKIFFKKGLFYLSSTEIDHSLNKLCKRNAHLNLDWFSNCVFFCCDDRNPVYLQPFFFWFGCFSSCNDINC